MGGFLSADSPALVIFGIYVAIAALAYLVGSLNTALLISKWILKDDVRTHGSGNAGTTNVARTYGARMGLITFAGDFAKTFLAVWLGRTLGGDYGALLAGVFCQFGHCWPVYFGFRGGKGVAAGAAMVLFVDWRVFLVLAAVFLVTFLLFRTISISSLLSALTLPFAFWFLRPGNVIYLILGVFLACMICFTHRANIRRIFRGEEKKFTLKKNT